MVISEFPEYPLRELALGGFLIKIIIRVPKVIFLSFTRHFLFPALLPQSQSDFQHLVVRDVLHVVLTDGAARGLHVPHEDLVQLASLLVRLRALLEDSVEAILPKLPGEGRELLVEVNADDNLGVSVLLDHVLHYLQGSRRLISHPLSLLRFQVAVQHMYRGVLDYHLCPTQVCPQGLDLHHAWMRSSRRPASTMSLGLGLVRVVASHEQRGL